MFCTNCGEKMDRPVKFCPNCGKKTVRKQIIKLDPVINRYRLLEAQYRRHILPHHDKLAKILPAATGIIVAFILISNIILPAYAHRMYDKGKEYIARMEYEEAVTAFSRASFAGINDSDVAVYMGEAYMSLEEYDMAKEILTTDDNDPTPAKLKLMADVWKYEGDGIMYENTLNQLISLTPNDPYAYLKLADYYREEGLYDNAAGSLEKLLARQKNSAASARLYNIYMESYAKNASGEKAAVVKDDAMKSLTGAVMESLDIGEGLALSLSPSGKFVLVQSGGNEKREMDIYALEDSAFIYHASFKIPAGYAIDGGMVAWSPDESKLAFSNDKAEAFVHDSSIYIYDIENQDLYNLTDPGEDYIHYKSEGGVYIIDSLPCFSQDSSTLYFSRRSIKGNWLCAINLDGKNQTHLFEPANGGYVDYKIMERQGKVYFSVTGHERNDLWGLYVYDEASGASRLKFDYDDRFYDLALKDMTADGRYLLYYLTISSQNGSMYFGVLDLETMKLADVYRQDIDSVNGSLSALNRSDVFGASRIFLSRNAAFSSDGKSLFVAEDGLDAYGKVIRRFSLSDRAAGDFVYLSFEGEGAEIFCVPSGNKSGRYFAQQSEEKFLVYDKGLRLITMELE